MYEAARSELLQIAPIRQIPQMIYPTTGQAELQGSGQTKKHGVYYLQVPLEICRVLGHDYRVLLNANTTLPPWCDAYTAPCSCACIPGSCKVPARRPCQYLLGLSDFLVCDVTVVDTVCSRPGARRASCHVQAELLDGPQAERQAEVVDDSAHVIHSQTSSACGQSKASDTVF